MISTATHPADVWPDTGTSVGRWCTTQGGGEPRRSLCNFARPVVAVVSFWLAGSTRPATPLVIASIIELAASTVLGAEIIRAADMSTKNDR